MTDPATSPAAEYRRRLERRRGEHARWARVDARFAYARLAVFAAAAVLAIAVARGALSYWWLLAPLFLFLVLIRRHERVIQRRDAAARALAFYERGLARIEDTWAGNGETGDRFRDEHHLYAHDLDLFGDSSLFQLLSAARTRDGEAMLARWLLAPADAGEIVARQAAVAELAPALDLREQLAIVGEGPLAIETGTLVAWAEAPPHPVLHRLRALSLLSAAAVLLTTGYLALTADVIPVLVVLILEGLVFRSIRQRLEEELHLAGSKARDLDALSALVTLIESARFVAPKLTSLALALKPRGGDAVGAIRRLHRLSEFHDWEHSLPLFPIGLFLAGALTGTPAYARAAIALGAAIVLWTPFLTVATEAWRKTHGHRVRTWIEVVATVEGLASLGAYHFEHPSDPFPAIVAPDTSSQPSRATGHFDGRELGHPLLPQARMVRNDVRLTSARQLLVVSGSNMSGKSTLLRTVGVNAVLALAGAPVRAASLTLSPLAVAATLRIQDSLQEGRSRFYAEITRVRTLADVASGPTPLLFLLDELFHGTNSHDRLVGGAGVLRSLLDRGAIGLVTTHDLALAAIVDRLGAGAANVHFEEWFDAGEMRFDYRIKPGPVTRSNALALMRAVGLEVEHDG